MSLFGIIQALEVTTKYLQAYAAVKFADACLRGLRGDAGVVECAFVASEVLVFFVLKNQVLNF